MILGRGFLPASDVALVQEAASKNPAQDFDLQIVTALKTGKLLSPDRIRDVLKLQTEERLLNLLGWFEGSYVLKPSAESPSPFPATSAVSLEELFRNVERFLLDGEAPFGAPRTDSDVLQGDLRISGGACLLTILTRRKATGRLIFERGPRRKMFVFESGKIASAVSTDPGETLATVLKRWKYLAADVVDRLEFNFRSQGGKFREMILKERLLSEQDIQSALITLHMERILEGFSWRSGKFEFRGGFKEPLLEEVETASGTVGASTHTKSETLRSPSLVQAAIPLETAMFDRVFLQGVRSAFLWIPQEDEMERIEVFRAVVRRWRQAGLRAALVHINSKDASGSFEETSEGDILAGAKSHTEMKEKALELERRYERLLWIGRDPDPEFLREPFFSCVIADVAAWRTERERLHSLLAEIPGEIPRYFFFRESAWSGRLARVLRGCLKIGAKFQWRHPS